MNRDEKQNRITKLWGKAVAKIDSISPRGMLIIWTCLFVLSVIPILILGNYNVMAVDDYDYGITIRATFLETGSVWQSVLKAAGNMKELFFSMHGGYVSYFLTYLCPMNFNYFAGILVPIIMVTFISVSTLLLGRYILAKLFGMENKSAVTVMLILLTMYYQVMESPFQGLYWWSGAVNYVVLQSLFFLLLVLWLCILDAKKTGSTAVYAVLAALLGVVVGGGNLVTILHAEIIFTLLVIYTFVKRKDKRLAIAVPYLVYTACFFINLLAPGNFNRQSVSASDVGMNPVKAIFMSFVNVIVYGIKWTNVWVIILWIASLPIIWKGVSAVIGKYMHPVLVSLLMYCILAAMFTPSLYGLGEAGLVRINNIIQLTYYLVLFLLTAYWCGYIKCYSYGDSTKKPIDETFLSSASRRITIAGLLLALVLLAFTADKNTYTSISATRSLVNGEAKTFYGEAIARYEKYVKAHPLDVAVRPYTVRVPIFDYDDLTEDADNWLNLAVRLYFNLDTVVVNEDGISPYYPKVQQ